jgi:hypothetical protein
MGPTSQKISCSDRGCQKYGPWVLSLFYLCLKWTLGVKPFFKWDLGVKPFFYFLFYKEIKIKKMNKKIPVNPH